MAGLTESEIKNMKKEFLSFDADGDGTISAEELAGVLKSFGDEVSEEEVRKVINHFDIDQNGTIEFHEFLIMMAHKPTKAEKEAMASGEPTMQQMIKKAFARRQQIRKSFESFDAVVVVKYW